MTAEPTGAGLAFERQRAAMAVTGTTGPEKAILLVLAIMANSSGEAWPPIAGPAGLTASASLGRRTVFEAIGGLEARGLLTRAVRPGKGTTYRLQLQGCASRTGAPSAPVREPRPTGAPAAPKQPGTPIPQKATPSSAARGARAAGADSEASGPLPVGTRADRWEAFVELRRAMTRGTKARPWTAGAEAAARRKLAKLAGEGEDPNAVLEQSVLEGWQGLFPVKADGGGRDGWGGGEGPTMRAVRRVVERGGNEGERT